MRKCYYLELINGGRYVSHLSLSLPAVGFVCSCSLDSSPPSLPARLPLLSEEVEEKALRHPHLTAFRWQKNGRRTLAHSMDLRGWWSSQPQSLLTMLPICSCLLDLNLLKFGPIFVSLVGLSPLFGILFSQPLVCLGFRASLRCEIWKEEAANGR